MDMIEDIRQLPELGVDEIHIWGVHVPGVMDQLDALHALLCRDEQEKAARFYREPDRQSSIAARGALRVLLSGYTGTPADQIGFQYSESGKPHTADPDIAFNVSHSGEWVVLAIGRNRSIGVDIEQIRRTMDIIAIASRYFTADEMELIQGAEDPHAAFFRLWSRKEAYVKACGSTLFQELSSFEVPFQDGEKDGWFFHGLNAGSRHAAAVVTDSKVDGLPCYDFNGLQW